MDVNKIVGRLFRVTLLFALTALIVGCQPSDKTPQSPEKKPAATTPTESQKLETPKQLPSSTEQSPEKTDQKKASVDVEEPKTPSKVQDGPLVEDVSKLRSLSKTNPVWIDVENGQVVIVGEVCQRRAPLEMFACLKQTKEHESIVAVDTKAAMVHAALLAVGAQAGSPVKFTPKYTPASGTEIDIEVAWKDKDGKIKRSKAQEWIRNVQTKKAMDNPWVFAGSGFWEDEQTREKHYMAEGGDFICVSNFPSATLDLPIESSQGNSALLFEAFTERIPPLGTPVTLILTPKPKKNVKSVNAVD